MRLKDKAALVSGAGSGIGRAIARRLTAEGARVLVVDINPEGGEETVQLVREAGGEARFFPADVTQSAQAEAMVEATLAAYGRIDIQCNNAGIEGPTALTADFSEEDYDRLMAVNLKGVWLAMKAAIPRMLDQGGAIVNTASVAGLVGFRGGAIYGATKAGVIALTRTAALEYARYNLRINCVCPGVIDTPMLFRIGGERHLDTMARRSPVGRLGQAEEIANGVVYLASDEASFVTGHPLVIDGGYVVQ